MKGLTAIVVAAASVFALAQTPARRDAARTREDAYRHNNVGVARLEQYDYGAAVTAFRRALDLQPDLAIAQVNLAIALLYDAELEAATQAARAAADRFPELPNVHFVRGLIARADNRAEDAAAAFERVLALDAADVGSRVQLGQVRLAQRQFAEAQRLFEEALRLEPFNATAAYGVAIALTRGGDRARGEKAMARFGSLRDNPAAITYATTYLEQGRYGEAIASTGLEPDLVDTATPAVTFADATSAWLPQDRGGVRGLTLADLDNDGSVDLLAAGESGVRLFRNKAGRLTPTPVVRAAATAVLAGDYDNDGQKDLLVLTERGLALYRQEAGGAFRDVTATALPAAAGAVRAAAFADVDHDGDVDLLAGTRLLRNNGNGRFEEITAAAKLTGVASPAAIVATDFDNRRDIDLLFAGSSSPPALFANERDGTFRNVASDVGLPSRAAYAVVASADVNKDMAPDYFFGRVDGPGVFALSARGGRFTLADAPADTAGALAASFVDYDGDGLSDLLVLTAAGPRLLRSVGAKWVDVTAPALARVSTAGAARATAMGVADLDGDTAQDIIVRTDDGQLHAWRNDAGKRQSLRVRLAARVSNRDAVGSKVELRAGSLRQRLETFAATPAVGPADVMFGLGGRTGVDVVRVLWPAGILQAETDVTLPGVTVSELDRKPSSCPFLFTWNGRQFEFVTDFLGGGEMGYWVAPGVRNVPDPDEYVRIPPGGLEARDGRYELRITNELEEALFVDRVQLVAVAHREGTEIYPNEGLRSPERRPPFEIYTVGRPRAPRAVLDTNGRDVRERAAAIDRRYVDGFRLSPIQGYADEHTLTIDTGASASDPRVLLLLTGWTDYAFSSDNVAAQQAGLAFRPPELQAREPGGEWTTVLPEIGLPVGRPQTVVVDVTAHTRRGVREFRVVTTLRVYWDRIQVDDSEPAPVTLARVEPATADLRWRGFSTEIRPGGVDPLSYDYARVLPSMPWKLLPGRYTRYGDVRPLLTATDDQFVIAAPGDEIAVAFEAAALPALPAGWTRTFLLYADGFSKEMNIHSSSPDDLEPLPFHAMTAYPYELPERYPDTPAHRAYREKYNTRVVGPRLPPLEAKP